MIGQTVILSGPNGLRLAHELIDRAPQDAVVNIRPPGRTLEQNSLLWSRLSDISRALPGGRKETPEAWKAIFMSALGHQCRFTPGLEGEWVPLGFRSSRLTKAQMSDLLEFIHAWGAEQGIEWTLETA